MYFFNNEFSSTSFSRYEFLRFREATELNPHRNGEIAAVQPFGPESGPEEETGGDWEGRRFELRREKMS